MTAPLPPVAHVAARRIDFLEWVRGIAAILVVVEHGLERLVPDRFPDLVAVVDPGRVGVVAFFLVSGYIIPLSFENQDMRTFVVRRLLRLYPLYWCLLVLQILLLAHDGELETGSTLTGAVVLLLNVLMLHGLLGLPSILGPAWTLSIEWVFYWQQMLAKRAGRLPDGWSLGYAWVAAYALMVLLESQSGRDLPTTLPMLLAVSCLGHAWSRYDRGSLAPASFRALLLTVLITVPAGSLLAVDTWTPVRYSASFVLGIGMFALAFRLRHLPGHPTLVWLGSISYAVYLSHTLVLRFLDSVVGLPAWMTAGACLVLVPLVGHVLHRAVEVPFIDMARRRTPPPAPRRDVDLQPGA